MVIIQLTFGPIPRVTTQAVYLPFNHVGTDSDLVLSPYEKSYGKMKQEEVQHELVLITVSKPLLSLIMLCLGNFANSLVQREHIGTHLIFLHLLFLFRRHL